MNAFRLDLWNVSKCKIDVSAVSQKKMNYLLKTCISYVHFENVRSNSPSLNKILNLKELKLLFELL